MLKKNEQSGRKPFNEHYDTKLQSFLEDFERINTPIEVDFRSLVNIKPGADRLTHLIHPYPAKLLTNIPYFFLNCSIMCKENSLVLDPFCGSGTVLLESLILGHKTVGADANPLGRFISKVKTTKIDLLKLERLKCQIKKNYFNECKCKAPQNLLDWSRWYSESVFEQLKKLAHVLSVQTKSDELDFLWLCFSVCARKLSLADPRVSVPVRLNPERYDKSDIKHQLVQERIKALETSDVFKVFSEVTDKNINRVFNLMQVISSNEKVKICNDARKLEAIRDESVDLIITSPPYASAQKYIRSSSLSIGWLQFSPDNTLRTLERKNIGREHYPKEKYCKFKLPPNASAAKILKEVYEINPLRSYIASNYLWEMKEAMMECYRVLKSNQRMVLVLGNNVVCGKNFDTRRYLLEICESIGFKLELILRDEINSRGLMTKRNKTASVITCEWILILKK